MKRTNRPSKATSHRVPGMTGRDGAIDFAVKADTLGASNSLGPDQGNERFSRVIGAAVIALWGDLPQDVQEQLFERAVLLGHRGERDEMLREQLAKFLHDHHSRTAGRPK